MNKRTWVKAFVIGIMAYFLVTILLELYKVNAF